MEGLQPILRVYIDTQRQVLAHQAAYILERLPMAYANYQQRSKVVDTATLRIVETRAGSLLLDLLSVTNAAVDLYEHREILAGFVAQLNDALQVMAGFNKGKVSSTNRTTIEALAAPVANDNARQVCVQVVGDNNTILIIDRETAQLIRDNRSAYVQPRPVSFDGETESAPDLQWARAPAADPVHERTFVPAEGIMTWVNGTWYVRPDGPNATLIPLLGGDTESPRLRRDRGYRVKGRIITQDGVSAAFEVARRT